MSNQSVVFISGYSPASLLGGLVPVDAATDPASAADAVAAAEALARRGRV